MDGKDILTGLDLSVAQGEIHAIMGPNGSGKSTLAHVLAGRDGYEVTGGEILFEGSSLLDLTPEERACQGVFLAFQYPVEIPGVNNTYFLKAAVTRSAGIAGSPSSTRWTSSHLCARRSRSCTWTNRCSSGE